MPEDTSVQPKLAELLTGYVQRQAQAQAAGLATSASEAEVVPYEAGPVHPVDPKLAWEGTLAVAKCIDAKANVQGWQPPPGWAELVASHEPVVALACAMGNFPQMVRHFHTLLQTRTFSLLLPGTPGAARSTASPALLDWARHSFEAAVNTKQVPEQLLAVGILRLAKQFDEAEKLFQANDTQVPAAYRTAWDNERAALAWHRGQPQQASDAWQRLEPTGIVLFNRGMAELFLDQPKQAQISLKEAVALLPEEGAWHHLGRLYLTLALSR